MISLHQFTFNPFAENTFVVWDTESGAAAVIDPGMSTTEENEEFSHFIASQKLQLERLLLTHAHIDHVLGCDFVSRQYQLKPEGHKLVPETLAQSKRAAQVYQIPYTPSPQPVNFLSEGDEVVLGVEKFEVRETPGHAPCHLVFVHHESQTVIGGDVLFKGSVGRVDLPGGDAETLIISIRTKLYSLPDAFTVYCGHGPKTTIGHEAQNNPFVRR